MVINFCRDLPGAESVYLHVKSLNENAINFYKKSGFKEREHVRGYYTIENAKYDAIVLEKRMKSDEPGVEKPS